MNNETNDIIEYIFNYSSRLELLLLSHINKKFNKIIGKEKYKNITNKMGGRVN